MAELFSGGGGYRWLDSWVRGNIIQLWTHRFCETFLTHRLADSINNRSVFSAYFYCWSRR
jgi:hypothetical protein